MNKNKAAPVVSVVQEVEPEPKKFKKVCGIMVSIYPNGRFVATFPDGTIHTSDTFDSLSYEIELITSSMAQAAAKNVGPPKLPDFEENVRSEYYRFNPFDHKTNKDSYEQFSFRRHQEFYKDGKAYLIQSGVPEIYVSRVMHKAWEDGHANGYTEVLNCMHGLIEIFAGG